jgi:hypothetical protein
MLRYRRRHRLPESDAAALMHRSGECNCGAFASAAQEGAMLKKLYPDFFKSIEALEAQAAGLRPCVPIIAGDRFDPICNLGPLEQIVPS